MGDPPHPSMKKEIRVSCCLDIRRAASGLKHPRNDVAACKKVAGGNGPARENGMLPKAFFVESLSGRQKPIDRADPGDQPDKLLGRTAEVLF